MDQNKFSMTYANQLEVRDVFFKIGFHANKDVDCFFLQFQAIYNIFNFILILIFFLISFHFILNLCFHFWLIGII